LSQGGLAVLEIDVTLCSLFGLGRRLAETNPTAKAATLRRQEKLLLELHNNLEGYINGLSDDKCSTYLNAKSDASIKRRVADEDAQRVFEKAPVTGIGTEAWQILWEAARHYSQEHAYKAIPFPNTSEDARCVRIPGQVIQRFQSKASTDSNRSHPVIPEEVIHLFQREAIQFLEPAGTVEGIPESC
jgi:predicted DNA binding CopG/RHH family protein